MRRRFVTLDVFTDTRFAGNPLAVVLDAGRSRHRRDADDRARVQSVRDGVRAARRQDAAHRAKLRIFTPGVELPFAGPSDGRHGRAARADRRRCAVARVRARTRHRTGALPGDADRADAGRAVFDLPPPSAGHRRTG